MRTAALFLMMLLAFSALAFAEELINTTPNATLNATGESAIASPWERNSKVCIFLREWVLKGVFLVIILVFLTGVATISGAAFPEWRNYGSQMIVGSILAVILYTIGLPALSFFMGGTVCGLGG